MKHPLFLSFLCCLKTQDFELLESFPTIAQDQKRKNSQGSIILLTISAWEKKKKNQIVDPHFSHATPLDRRDLLLFVKNLVWKSWSPHLFYFILKGK